MLMLLEELKCRCGDETALQSLIATHLKEMDNADFFEALCKAIDDKDCVTAIARIHLEQSGDEAQRLVLVTELFDAFNQGCLNERLEALTLQIDLEQAETILHAAEHALDQKGLINAADALLQIAKVVLDRFQYGSLRPYLNLVESEYHLLVRQPEAALAAISAALANPTASPLIRDALAVNQGLALFRLGKLKEAVSHYEQIVPTLDDPYQRRSALSNLAMVRGELGQFSRALAILSQLAEECEAANEFSHLAKAYGNSASLYGRLGLISDEERYLLLGLESAKRRPPGDKGYDWNTLITSFFNLALFYIRRELLDLAERYFEQFKESAKVYGVGPYQLSYARALLHLHFKRGRREKALNIITNVLREQHPEDDEFLAFLGIAATISYRYGLIEQATALFSRLSDAAMRIDCPEFKLTASGYLGLCQIQQGALDEAFEGFDRMFAEERRLRDEIGVGHHQPTFSADKEGLYLEILRDTKPLIDNARLFSFVQHCKAPSLGYNARTTDDYGEIRPVIPEGVLIAEYFHKQGLSFCLLASRDLEVPIEIPLEVDEKVIREWVIRLSNQIPHARFYMNRDPFPWFIDLWQGLVQPLEPFLSSYRHLVVATSGEGYHLPFHLFPDHKGHRLIERMAVSYTPNTALFAAAQGITLAEGGASSLVLACGRPDDDEMTLQHFEQEAVSVGQWLGAIPLLDPPNALKVFQENVGVKIIHIANHGRFDASAPFQSGLYLRQGGVERVLLLDELYGLPLAADLIFLSGCDTGRVNVQKNEEPVGLLAPLLGGKVRTAVLSFWPIVGGMDLTVELVSGFYRYWKGDGLSKAEALRKSMLDHSDHPNPYLWGGYGLYGAI